MLQSLESELQKRVNEKIMEIHIIEVRLIHESLGLQNIQNVLMNGAEYKSIIKLYYCA